MTDPYEQRLAERVNRHFQGAYEGLAQPWGLPEAAAEAALRELLETGCLSQHAANITAARRAFSRLPPAWVSVHLPRVLPVCLFQEPAWREWEFCRAAELLELFPEARAWLMEYGKDLHDPEIDEAIEELRGSGGPGGGAVI